MVIVLLLLLLLLWAALAVSSTRRYNLDQLRCALDTLATGAGYQLPNYRLVETPPGEVSRTEFRDGEPTTIYLCLRRRDTNGKITNYDSHTVKMAYIHELSHLLSPHQSHDALFYQIEGDLTKEAIRSGWLRGDAKVDSRYPCRG